jgi:hypothetical protein
MTAEQEYAKGQKADQLLANETFKDAMAKVRQGIFDKWAESPIRDTEGQHELKLMLKLLDDLEANIRSVANTGKLALKQIEHERTIKEQIRQAGRGLMSMIRA